LTTYIRRSARLHRPRRILRRLRRWGGSALRLRKWPTLGRADGKDVCHDSGRSARLPGTVSASLVTCVLWRADPGRTGERRGTPDPAAGTFRTRRLRWPAANIVVVMNSSMWAAPNTRCISRWRARPRPAARARTAVRRAGPAVRTWGRSGGPGPAGRPTRAAATTSSCCWRAPRWSLPLPGHTIAHGDQVVTVDQPLHGRAYRGTNQWPTCRSSRHLLRAPGRA